MSGIKIAGLKSSDGQVFHPIEPGKYNCRITKVEEKLTKDTSKFPKSPYWNFKAVVKEDEASHAGKVLFFMCMLPTDELKQKDIEMYEMCVNKMRRVMDACQLEVSDSEEVDSQDFIGAELALVVVIKNDKNEVSDQLPITI